MALSALNATLERRVDERSALLAETEEALRQSQKLEAIGQLTGGVAHDFNNLLTIIRSSVDFLSQPELAQERKIRYLRAIADTVERASKLTSQLLAFARRQPLKPQVFNACERVQAMGGMLESVTGAMVRVEVLIDDPDCFVRADMSQFETALVNMALNARDAMEGEGTLCLHIRKCESLPSIRGSASIDDDFVAISLTDKGSGIDPTVLHQIFEPFFTTKAVGKGTGLGLSQVFGFAKQSGGDIEVQTVLGQGTVFILYLPKAESVFDVAELQDSVVGAVSGACWRVLVVEDNLEIGQFAVQILEDLGYQPSRAHSVKEALEMIGNDAENFDVVFSDVVMPGDSGVVLARELRRRRKDLPIVLTSGYSSELAEFGVGDFEFVPKPYSVEQIVLALSKVMSKT